MGTLGWIHTALGLLAIALGLVIFRTSKGSQLHRVMGYGYIASMIGLNATALLIYRVFGGFGPFHVLALISLATVAASAIPAVIKRPRGTWLARHYDGMCWSYIGLLAATVAEIIARLPFVRDFGLTFGIATFLSSIAVVLVGSIVLYGLRDRALASVRAPVARSNNPVEVRASAGIEAQEFGAAER
jgi:uncharacterized membrane protein